MQIIISAKRVSFEYFNEKVTSSEPFQNILILQLSFPFLWWCKKCWTISVKVPMHFNLIS